MADFDRENQLNTSPLMKRISYSSFPYETARNRFRTCTLLAGAVLLLMTLPSEAATLYVGMGSPDLSNGSIESFTPSGAKSIVAIGLPGPYGLAFDSHGNLYESDFVTGAVNKLTPGGQLSPFATVRSESEGMTFDSAGNLYVACFGEIDKVTPSGVRSVFVTLSTGSYSQAGLTIDRNGNLFAGNYGLGGNSGGVLEISPSGVVSTFASNLSGGDGVAFDASGSLFVSEFGTGFIYKYATNGSRTTFATGLNNPEDLAFDRDGYLYEADNGTGTINKFTPAGARSTFATNLSTGLDGPHSLAFAPVPEPPAFLLAVIGGISFLIGCRKTGRQGRNKEGGRNKGEERK